MKVDGSYTAAFALYGYLPDAAFSQNTRSLAVFGQDEWHAGSLNIIGGAEVLARQKARRLLRQRAE
jgi:hypothetical protein